MSQQNQISVEKVQLWLGELFLTNKLAVEALQKVTAENEQIKQAKIDSENVQGGTGD